MTAATLDRRPSQSPDHSELMRLSGLGKKYGPVTVLQGVNLAVRPGEIHAIIGENGAGKSTLMRLISGHVQPTVGSIRFLGEDIAFSGPVDAERRGIVLVHQEILLAEDLTVVENLFLGREMTRNGVIDDRTMEEIAAQQLANLGCTARPRQFVRDLSIAQRQMVQIARALLEEHRIVIFDEPTAVLTTSEVDILLDKIRALRDRGVTVLYISHRLDEVEALADRVTVLRDGHMVGTYDADSLAQEDMARLMVGRELSMLYPPKRGATEADPIFEVENLSVPGYVDHVSFVARPGEVLGFGGMIGAGRTEVFEGILGLRPAKSTAIRVRGKQVNIKSVADGVDEGIGYLTEDRKGKGLLLREKLAPNLVLTALSSLYRKLFIDDRIENAALDEAVRSYDIRVRSRKLEAGQLSGGNQQKLLLAKIMMLDPSIVIIDEPTRGIDIGNKSQIYSFIDDLVRRGKACIVISSELQELIGLCDRVLVMKAGRITAELRDNEVTEDAVVLAATVNSGAVASREEKAIDRHKP